MHSFVRGRRAITRWLPKRPPARAQVAAVVMVVMVVIMSIPITRENAGMHIPWEARARAAKWVDVYGMERAV